jgi:hypothetical protein
MANAIAVHLRLARLAFGGGQTILAATPHVGIGARGLSLHAATTVAANDRESLERLCRYVNRPPLAYGRLRRLDHGDLAFALKTKWRDGKPTWRSRRGSSLAVWQRWRHRPACT